MMCGTPQRVLTSRSDALQRVQDQIYASNNQLAANLIRSPYRKKRDDEFLAGPTKQQPSRLPEGVLYRPGPPENRGQSAKKCSSGTETEIATESQRAILWLVCKNRNGAVAERIMWTRYGSVEVERQFCM